MGPRETNPKADIQPLRIPKAKALLVEEDPGNLRYYSNILEGYGYRVRACNSFREGVLCMAEEVFDFVMVSQGTPKFEGICVLKRATEINRSLPVLVVARCLDGLLPGGNAVGICGLFGRAPDGVGDRPGVRKLFAGSNHYGSPA